VKVTCLTKPPTTDPNWSCHFCQKMFSTAEQLTFHGQRQHNTLRPFHCSFCKFSTKNYGLLKRHLNSHTRANQVDWDVCGKAFLCKSDMNRHRSVHSDERNVKCVHCDECFKSDYFLGSHIKRVHCKDMENYKCKVKSATDCKDHEAAKHECPRYFCNQCEYKASRLDSLKIHHLTKHEGARYPCFQCETKPP
jgi:KRAB domain-containing zinc finger protein